MVPLTEVIRCALSPSARCKENWREVLSSVFSVGKRDLRLPLCKSRGKCRLSSNRESIDDGSTSLETDARRIPVKQGANRPVLKHGPRSSTYMRVYGCEKPKRETNVKLPESLENKPFGHIRDLF